MNKKAVRFGLRHQHSKITADEPLRVSNVPFVVILNIFKLLLNIHVSRDLSGQMVPFLFFPKRKAVGDITNEHLEADEKADRERSREVATVHSC